MHYRVTETWPCKSPQRRKNYSKKQKQAVGAETQRVRVAFRWSLLQGLPQKRFSCSKKENNGCSRKVGRELENGSTHGHFNKHNRTKDIVRQVHGSPWKLHLHPRHPNETKVKLPPKPPGRTVKLKLNLSHTQQKSIYCDHWRKPRSSFPSTEITIAAAETCLKVFLMTRNDPRAVTPIRCLRLLQKCTLKTPPHPHTPTPRTSSQQNLQKRKQHKEPPFAWVLLVNPL